MSWNCLSLEDKLRLQESWRQDMFDYGPRLERPTVGGYLKRIEKALEFIHKSLFDYHMTTFETIEQEEQKNRIYWNISEIEDAINMIRLITRFSSID